MNIDAEVLESTVVQECRNCGRPGGGEYCNGCGQRYGQERLSFRLLQRWFVACFLDVDHGLLLTVRDMVLRPGRTIRSYVVTDSPADLNPSQLLVLLVREHRLPQLELVAVGIEDPGKATVVV
jgi:hypothetical protein